MLSLKQKILSGLFVLTFLIATLMPLPVAYGADLNQHGNLCGGAGLEVKGGGSCGNTNQGDLNTLITRIVNLISVIVGIVAVIMIIFGGFRYITSGGDSGNVSSAKNTIIYAIVGLIIVALAQVIVRFVINKSTGLTE